jgi:hypothetical protein
MIKSRIGWVGHSAFIGEMRNAYKILVRGPEGKRPLGKPSHRWKDNNIKMGVKETGYGMWTEFVWHRIETSGRLL